MFTVHLTCQPDPDHISSWSYCWTHLNQAHFCWHSNPQFDRTCTAITFKLVLARLELNSNMRCILSAVFLWLPSIHPQLSPPSLASVASTPRDALIPLCVTSPLPEASWAPRTRCLEPAATLTNATPLSSVAPPPPTSPPPWPSLLAWLHLFGALQFSKKKEK